MKTAEEMYQYCEDNGYGSGFTKKTGIKHFKIIEENLGLDEEVYMTFIGLRDYYSLTKHKNNYAYAITNKRIMFSQKKIMGVEFKSVVLDRFNDLSLSKGLALGVITFDTLGEIFNVAVDKYTADKISNEAQRIIFEVVRKQGNTETNEINNVDEIRKYKLLLDDGIITENEFEEKKKELLK